MTKKSGEDIQANVLEVTTTEIKYKKFESQNGPTYSILKSDVLMIRYKDGTKDIFAQEKNSNVASAPSTTNSDSKAIIYFIRSTGFNGSLAAFTAFIDKQLIGIVFCRKMLSNSLNTDSNGTSLMSNSKTLFFKKP